MADYLIKEKTFYQKYISNLNLLLLQLYHYFSVFIGKLIGKILLIPANFTNPVRVSSA